MSYRSIVQKRLAIKSNMLIVGIDIGKRRHVARMRLPDRSFTSPLSVANDLAGFTRLLEFNARWQKRTACRDIIVGMEPTGHYFKPLARWLTGQGVKVVLVNPVHVNRTKETFDNSPTKVDPKDAILIADLVGEGKYFTLRLATGTMAALQKLVWYRDQLVGDRTAVLNRIQADLYERFPEFTTVYGDVSCATVRHLLKYYPSPAALAGKTVGEVTRRLRRRCPGGVDQAATVALLAKADATIGSEEGWAASEQVLAGKLEQLELLEVQVEKVETAIEGIVQQIDETQYLTSIKGVGLMTAATILAESGGLRQYARAESLIKLAGLDLCEWSTGQHHGRRHISHHGRSRLRSAIFMAALVQTRKNMPLQRYYQHLVEESKKRPVVALIAVGCRLIRLMYALVRDERRYTEQAPKRVPGDQAA